MDTVNHLSEVQLREELIRSQNTLAELQTAQSSLRARNDQLRDGLNNFVEVVLGPALRGSKLKQIIRELLREELEKVQINTDNMELDISIESFTTEAKLDGEAYLELPD